MQINLSKLLCLTAMIPWAMNGLAVAQQGQGSLDVDDTLANSYIEDALSDLPPKPPSIEAQHAASKKALIQQREDAQSRLTVDLPRKSSADKRPALKVESINKDQDKDKRELYELLSRQTGLEEHEIEALFSGEKTPNNNKTDTAESNTPPAFKQPMP